MRQYERKRELKREARNTEPNKTWTLSDDQGDSSREFARLGRRRRRLETAARVDVVVVALAAVSAVSSRRRLKVLISKRRRTTTSTHLAFGAC